MSEPSSSRTFDSDLAGDVDGDVVGQRDGLGLGLLAQNGDLGLEVGRLDVGDQAPLEARAQPLLEGRDFVRRGVAADDDLLGRVEERVEGVEELGLRALLAADELDVVDQQHVDVRDSARGSRGCARSGAR